MSKLTVEDTSLVAVADAIRTKGGTTDTLVFPDGFVDAIGNIQSGGGENYLVGLLNGTLTNITADMLAGCTKLSDYAFYNSNIISIVIPESVTTFGSSLFYDCTKLTNIVLPESATSITNGSFYQCNSLTSIDFIPESVTTIGNSTFRYCNNIADVVIPKNVTSIGTYAFYYNSALTTITLKPTTPPTIQSSTFSNCKNIKTIKVPSASLSAYRSATNWSSFSSKMIGV